MTSEVPAQTTTLRAAGPKGLSAVELLPYVSKTLQALWITSGYLSRGR